MKFSFFNICTIVLCALLAQASTLPESHQRNKRQYYYDGYYGAYAGYTLYRIIGIIIGIILMCLCCLLPCICIAGIWFAGWFGIRNRGKSRVQHRTELPPPVVIQNTAPSAYIPPREPRETHEVREGRDGRAEGMIYQIRETDRYFEEDGPRSYGRYERRKTSRL